MVKRSEFRSLETDFRIAVARGKSSWGLRLFSPYSVQNAILSRDARAPFLHVPGWAQHGENHTVKKLCLFSIFKTTLTSYRFHGRFNNLRFFAQILPLNKIEASAAVKKCSAGLGVQYENVRNFMCRSTAVNLVKIHEGSEAEK